MELVYTLYVTRLDIKYKVHSLFIRLRFRDHLLIMYTPIVLRLSLLLFFCVCLIICKKSLQCIIKRFTTHVSETSLGLLLCAHLIYNTLYT